MIDTFMTKILLIGLSFFGGAIGLFAQPSFLHSQKSYDKIAEIFARNEDNLKREFEERKIIWPPKELYIRSFKFDQLVEVWIKNEDKKTFKLFKTYHICMPSGVIGPKRVEGDLQIPEGFYYINEFNPNSNYHLSLGLNYPNASDHLLSDSIHPGGEIYIHGNCVSVGCLAITDIPIEELYILATYARTSGQDFIPVHVFPVKYDVKNSINYLNRVTRNNKNLQQFWLSLKQAFDFFDEKKKLPLILVNIKGEYLIN